MSLPAPSPPAAGGSAGRPARQLRAAAPPVAGFLLLILAGLATSTAARAEIKACDPFPSLSAANLEGDAIPATEGKVVLVDFWASWCAPCKTSFPAYAKLDADYTARGLVIVAVSVDENPAAYAAFVKKLKPPFVTLRDKTQQLVRDVKVPGMPTCYLIGRDGRVQLVHQGYRGSESDRQIRRAIDKLLAGQSLHP